MKPSLPLRVGIIGAGWVAAARHIPAFQRDRRVRVVAVADHMPGRAAALARRFSIPAWTNRVEELLDEVDLVSICTPPWTHAELATTALARGRHVLVEKPLATRTADARAVQRAVQTSSARLGVVHNFLYARSVRAALARAATGRCGTVHTIFAFQLSSSRRRLPRWGEQLPGGLFYDEAPHMVYLIRAFLGEVEVSGGAIRPGGDGRPARISARLAGTQGDASLEMVFGSPLSEWTMAVIASKGAMLLDLFRDIAVFLDADGAHRPIDVLRTSLSALTQHAAGVAASGTRLLGRRLDFGHDLLVKHFIDALLGRAPVPAGADDGLAVVRVLDAILGREG